MTSAATRYTEAPASEVPDSIIFTTPVRNQGQIVEVSYSTGTPAGLARNYDADEGDPWMQETDHSTGSTRFYRLTCRNQIGL